jgi:hypothetical protein
LRPRWLAWHAFVVLATVGMLLLGDWQLHRAESGNELSWAYTFEWPLFAAFTLYFWVKSLRDELHQSAAAGADSQPDAAEAGAAASDVSGSGTAESPAAGAALVGSAAASDTGAAATTAPAVGATEPSMARGAAWVAETARAAGSGGRANSWDSTSWDAASWDATSKHADEPGAGTPVDVSRATPADGEAYVARLLAEVQRSGNKRGRR